MLRPQHPAWFDMHQLQAKHFSNHRGRRIQAHLNLRSGGCASAKDHRGENPPGQIILVCDGAATFMPLLRGAGHRPRRAPGARAADCRKRPHMPIWSYQSRSCSLDSAVDEANIVPNEECLSTGPAPSPRHSSSVTCRENAASLHAPANISALTALVAKPLSCWKDCNEETSELVLYPGAGHLKRSGWHRPVLAAPACIAATAPQR